MAREGVELVAVATDEVAEHGAGDQGCLSAQAFDEAWHVAFGVEAETVHSCVELDVDGEIGDAFLLGSMDELFEQGETEHLWLQAVVEEGLEGGGFGVHNHDVGCDAPFAQVGSFVGHRHGEIIHTIVLKGLAGFE